MGLKELRLKNSYRSVVDDIPEDFFNKVLPETRLYLRAAGYYSSSSLKSICYGLSKMFWSNGKMKLLISPEISEEDLNAIRNGRLNPEVLISEIFIKEEAELESLMENDNVRALSYFVAKGDIEIKFVINPSANGLFHMKFGVMKDENGDTISFSGSINESEAGLTKNVEEIKVFKSFETGQKAYIDGDISFFNDLFYGNEEFGHFIIVELPEKAKEMLSRAGKNKNEEAETNDQPQLRPCQIEAIDALEKNNMRGIVEMATGTGKTRVALESIKSLISVSQRPVLVLVLAPASVLVNQWKREWWHFFKDPPLVFGSSGKAKLDDIYNLDRWGNRAKGTAITCICTYEYASKPSFLETLKNCLNHDLAIVCDEVHWIGAPTYSIIMDTCFKYRIGLSATPTRYFDEDGTNNLMEYFNGVVYEYNLGRAIEEGHLSRYDYVPEFVPLLYEEMIEYSKLTKEISRLPREDLDGSKTQTANLKGLLYKRAKILKKASNKKGAFFKRVEQIAKNKQMHNALIFFEDNDQIDEYIHELEMLDVYSEKLSGEENAKERDLVLKRFESGNLDCIVSMKVLDEGIDLRKADKAFLLANTSNPRQYIQRCGRVLRTHTGKTKAVIYDFLVYPDVIGQTSLEPTERGIMDKEFKRAYYFASQSSNKGEGISAINEMARKFNISTNEYH